MGKSIAAPDVVSKGNLYKIALHENPDIVQSVEGFNVRQEFGDMDWLTESIIRDGMRVPAQGFSKDGVYYITDGHRRLKAAKAAVELGNEIIFLIQLEPKGYQESDRVLDMLTRNSGLPFTMLEEAHLFARLSKFNFDEHQIAAKTGRSVVHVKNALLLLTAEPETQQKVADNQVSASTVVEMLKKTDAPTVEKNVAEALETSGKKRVTAKDIKDAPSGRDRKVKAPKNFNVMSDEQAREETEAMVRESPHLFQNLQSNEKVGELIRDLTTPAETDPTPPADFPVQQTVVTVKDGAVVDEVIAIPPGGEHTKSAVYFVKVNDSDEQHFPTLDIARVIARLKLANYNLGGEWWSNTFDVLDTLDKFAKGDIDWTELQSQFIIH